MRKYILIALILTVSACVHAQDSASFTMQEISADTIPVDKLSVGVGGGYEFGGLGANVIYYFTKALGVFAGAGYPLTGFGYNAGAKLRIVVDQSAGTFMPYVIVMYGYNATIIVPSFPEKNKIFYGLSVGAGVDYRPGNSKFGYLSATVYLPIRSTAVKDYAENLNYFYGIPYATNRIFPLSLSLGYKFIFLRHKITPVKIELP
jgi:hypothetical protein